MHIQYLEIINIDENKLSIIINEKDLHKLNDLDEKIKIKSNLNSLTIIKTD